MERDSKEELKRRQDENNKTMAEKKLNILFVSEYFPPASQGGGEISCSLLAKALAKKGINVTVLTSMQKGLKKKEQKDGYSIIRRLNTGKSPSSIFSNIKREFCLPGSVRKEVKRIISTGNIDMVHYFNTNVVSGVPELRIPQIAHINSPVFFSPTGIILFDDDKLMNNQVSFVLFLKKLIRSEEIGKMKARVWIRYNPFAWLFLWKMWKRRMNMLKKLDGYIAVSEFMKSLLIKEKIAKNKITVVPNIVDGREEERQEGAESNKITSKIKKNRRTRENVTRMVYLGSLNKYKGVYLLIEALREIKKTEFSCDIYGEGPEKKNIEKLLLKYGGSIRIKDPVPHSKTQSILAESDIVIFPSLVCESFGRVAIEANMAGCLFIGSDVGGVRDIVINKNTGILFKAGSKKQLTKAIINAINNRNDRERIIQNGKQHAKNFSEDKIADSLLRAYYKQIRH